MMRANSVRQMRILFISVTLVVLSWLVCDWGTVGAAQVEGLYTAEVETTSKEESERNLALGKALRDVLVKVTGERDPQTYPGVVPAMSDPSKYVEQFGYRVETIETIVESEIEDPFEESVDKLTLWARFDSRAIDGLIRDAGLPIWGKTRPSMIMWLALEDQSGRFLVGAEDSPTITEVLHYAAQARGLPFVVPLMDLVDLSAVSVSDVWAGFPDKILSASRRYRADAVLLARVHQFNSDQWEARWRLFLGDTLHDWVLSNEELDGLLAQGLNQAVDVVAAQFVQTAGGVGDELIEIVVNDIRTLGDYARTLNYLQALDGVSRVDVDGALGSRIRFSLTIRGGSPAFNQVIGFGRILVPMNGSDGSHYRLLP